MKTLFTDLTYKIVAFQEITEIKTEEIIQWAIEMVELGNKSENLLMLASFEKDSNFYEVESYLKKTLFELNLISKKGKEALISYSYYYIIKISESTNLKQNLTELYQYCLKWDYEENIFDFYLLYWALCDFEYGEEYSHYWESANRENINSIIIETAKKWLLKYRKEIELVTS